MMNRRRQPSGLALMPVIMLVVGLLIGIALGIVPRLFGFDPLKFLKKEEVPVVAEKVPEEKEKVLKKRLELDTLINEMKRRRAELDARAKPLAAQEALLKQESDSLAQLKKDMEAVEKRIIDNNLQIKTAEVKNVKKLAKMWAQMEPTEVAKVLKGLDVDLATKIMSAMQESQSAQIVQALTEGNDPARAALAVKLTEKIKQLKQETPPAVTEAQ
jgi:flagellar motility protein MotE (MotC chaperone)